MSREKVLHAFQTHQKTVLDDEAQPWRLTELSIRDREVIRMDEQWFPKNEEIQWVVSDVLESLPEPFCSSDRMAQTCEEDVFDLPISALRNLVWKAYQERVK